jgi:hypothetical protein
MPALTRSRRRGARKLPGISRHNEGRKPFYKEHRLGLSADDILAQEAVLPWWNNNYDWSEDDEEKLDVLADDSASIEKSALSLGRSPKALAWHARDIGLTLPPEWSKLIQAKYVPRERRTQLSYPYIIKARPEHADILALNAIVPHVYPAQMRADICQEMMLAVLEGRVTIENIKANRKESAWFLRKFYMANHEDSGRALSMTNSEYEGDNNRSSDEIASSLAAQDWHTNQVYERTKFINALSIGFQPPTQLDDAHHAEVRRAQSASYLEGLNLSYEEAEEFVESGEWQKMRHGRSHFKERAAERFGIRLNKTTMAEIADRCRDGHAQIIDEEGDDIARMVVPYGGKMLPVVYSRTDHYIITVLPKIPEARW